MGLLDSLLSGSQGGYGGLLDALMYQSPLTQQKPNYATNEFDSQFLPQAPDPFGGLPQMSQPNPQQFQPPSPFNGGAAPVFAGMPQGQPQAPIMPQQPAPQPAPAPQNGPINTADIGGYQMPQFGSAADYTPQQAPQAPQGMPTDASAQSRQPQAPQELPPAFGGSGYLDRLNNGGGLIGSLLGDTTQQKNLKAQYDAVQRTLIDGGMSPREAQSKAMLAVMNPEAGKVILQEALTSKEKFGVISDNPIEGKKYGFTNERDQTVNGKPISQSGGQSSAGGLLAQGATYDPNRTGEDYLNQFSPDVKAAVKAYINGDVVPAGNPRQQAIAAQAKTIAQKYGQDMGIPVSDTLYAEKRKYRTELGTNSPNSAGGQAKAFNQGISHMTSLADNLEKLDNSNGLGIPLLAQGANAVRQGFSNQQSAIADEAKSLGQTVAGEVGKLFSGSAGGGVHERELTRERFDTVKSKPQLAAALRATLETMQGGLHALEQRRDAVLGPNSGVELVDESTKQNIVKIQGVIDRLEGKSSGNQTKTGVTWSVVK